MRDEEVFRERLAALQHEQWQFWSKDVAKELEGVNNILYKLQLAHVPIYEKIRDRLDSWKKYWVSYNDLEDKVKDYDRSLADKVIKEFKRR